MTSAFQSQLNVEQTAHPQGFLADCLTDNQYKSFLFLVTKSKRYQRFYYSHQRIADELGCSIASVKRWFNVLKALNIIQVVHRGYLKTNEYVLHEFYRQNRHLFFSKYKNFLDKGLLTISKAALSLRELLLRTKVSINIIYQRTSFEEREKKMFQLSDEQSLEAKKYPRWAYDRALSIVKVKSECGVVIKNPAAFFMTVLRGEASKKQQPTYNRQPQARKDIQKGVKSQPYARPATGPYAIYQHKEKVITETDFEIATKLEQAYHDKPNMFSVVIADIMISKLSLEEKEQIWYSIHTEQCGCRSK